MQRAQASQKDGDILCSTARELAQLSNSHEEEGVFHVLKSNKLLVDIPWTYLDLGDTLKQHPCFHPRDLITSLAELGKLANVIGTSLDSCGLVKCVPCFAEDIHLNSCRCIHARCFKLSPVR